MVEWDGRGEYFKMLTAHKPKAVQASSLEILRQDIHFGQTKETSRFIEGSFERRPVLIEIFQYKPDPDTNDPPAPLTQRLKQVAVLLHLQKRLEFRILPCSGFFIDEARRRMGMVFERFPDIDFSQKSMSLLDMYKKDKYVPFGKRLKLAHILAVAVDHFHRVGWVHKELRSSNIFFFHIPESMKVMSGQSNRFVAEGFDLAAPWIFGFGYARAEDGVTALEEDYNMENNFYRHPSRVGCPEVKFRKYHDVYSLVGAAKVVYSMVMLTSIGCHPLRNCSLDEGRISLRE